MSYVTRYNPVEELLRGILVKPVVHPSEPGTRQIRMDVREQDGAYVVHAEIPGARREDIHVEIEGNQVSIVSEVRQGREVKEGERVLRSERFHGRLERSFQLADDIDEAQASAQFDNGLLVLTLPKKVGQGGKRLTVN